MIFEIVMIAFNLILLVYALAVTIKRDNDTENTSVMVEFIALDKVNEIISYATQGAACIDIRSTKDFILKPGEQVKINSGLKIWIKDPRYAGILLPRSGLGSKGLNLSHTAGVIDSDYQGEIMIPVKNTGNEDITIKRGQRIVQLGFFRIGQAAFQKKDSFSCKTGRGSGGFGSTGTK